MMNIYDIESMDRFLPPKVAREVSFGHIDKSCFKEDEIVEMKKGAFKGLSEQKIYLYSNLEEAPVYQSIGLWGEDTSDMSNDLGLACVFIKGDSYVIPEHFMSRENYILFVVEIATEHYPELLI